jgi:hypothetical protein
MISYGPLSDGPSELGRLGQTQKCEDGSYTEAACCDHQEECSRFQRRSPSSKLLVVARTSRQNVVGRPGEGIRYLKPAPIRAARVRVSHGASTRAVGTGNQRRSATRPLTGLDFREPTQRFTIRFALPPIRRNRPADPGWPSVSARMSRGPPEEQGSQLDNRDPGGECGHRN